MTPTEVSCSVLELKATFIESNVTNIYLHRDSNFELIPF